MAALFAVKMYIFPTEIILKTLDLMPAKASSNIETSGLGYNYYYGDKLRSATG
jgi:hypothetical protein